MPFKTRRQKIAAASRKFVFSDGKVSLVTNDKSSREKERGSQANKVRIDDNFQGTKEELMFVGKDVLKTLIIASLIIAFQLIILLRIG